MKNLLTLTAVIEVGAGLAIGIWPSEAVALLLGSSLDTLPALTVGRLAGVALLALGIACWFARLDGKSQAATGLIASMLLYNLGAVTLLSFANIYLGLHGFALWPAVVVHMALAIWCIICLRSNCARMGSLRARLPLP